MNHLSNRLMKTLVYEGPRPLNMRHIEIPAIEEGRTCFEKLLTDPGKTAKIMLSM